jgi:hypothetical protein
MLEINGIVAAALLSVVLWMSRSKVQPRSHIQTLREHPDYDDARSLRNRSERSEDWLNS